MKFKLSWVEVNVLKLSNLTHRGILETTSKSKKKNQRQTKLKKHDVIYFQYQTSFFFQSVY